MKLLIINPNSDKQTTQKIAERALRIKKKEDQIVVENLEGTPKLINTAQDVLRASQELEKRILAEQDGYEAFVIACHSDPGLEKIRRKSEKPVLGIGEVSYQAARLWNQKMGIIVPSASAAARKREAVRKYDCAELLAGIEVAAGDDWDSILRSAKKLQEKDVKTVILGCANYCYSKEALEKALRVRVLDGVSLAMKMAESLLGSEI